MARKQLGAEPSAGTTEAMRMVDASGLTAQVQQNVADISNLTGLVGTPSLLSSPNTLAKRNSAGQLIAATPTADSHLATKAYVDSAVGMGTWLTSGLSYGSGVTSYSPYPIQYIREGNWVSLRGLLQRTSGWGTSSTILTGIITLPSGYRPDRADFFPATFAGNESHNQTFKVYTDGTIDLRLLAPLITGGYYAVNNVRFWSP